MATIVNNPGSGGDNGGASGWIVAIVVIIILVLLALFVFPEVFRGDNDVDVVPAPTTGIDGTEPPIINNTTFNSTTTINEATTTDE